MYWKQHYVIKFVSDFQQVGGFSPGTPVSSNNKTDRHDIAEILLKVTLDTLTLTQIVQLFFYFVEVTIFGTQDRIT